jgi:tripartite-type tricarboxylate transporter receptor subunit TctC
MHSARLSRSFFILASLAATFCAVSAVSPALAADDFPQKTIKIISPFPPGGGTDFVARTIGKYITDTTGQQVIVENRPGANGFTGARAVATAPPDGYTIFLTSNTTHAANPAMFKTLPYDPIKDFAPVARITISPSLLVVAADNKEVQTVADLAKRAKENPGKVLAGDGTSSGRIAMAMYATAAGVQFKRVPYPGNPQALTDIMGRQIDLLMSDPQGTMALIEANSVRVLAVTSEQRSVRLPNIPTMAESGYPGFSIVAWTAAYVPAGTPRPIIDRLASLIEAAVRPQEMKDFVAKGGSQVDYLGPEDLAKFNLGEIAKWAKAVKDAGIEMQD